MTGTVHLRIKHDRPLRNRHPWLFSGAIDRVESDTDAPPPGDVMACRDHQGRFLAWGTYNPTCRIAFRALSFSEDVVPDAAWVRQRAVESIARRIPLVPRATNAYRLVHAEADGLPGLIVDRFAGVIVCQITTAGMHRFESEIVEVLAEELSPEAVIVRTPRRPAKEEGISQGSRVAFGSPPDESVEFTERGVRFVADPKAGQKTGFYLDQRDNRHLVRKLAGGRRVLDAYSYTGAFGVYAALGGATSVLCVDSSEQAIDQAARHAKLNEIPADRLSVRRADVPKFLRDDSVGPFDLIVLDPPPLSPGRGAAQSASRAYKDINLHAMKRLAPGGLLLTFSCSQAIGADLLGKIVFGAALDAGVQARVLDRVAQPFDHPVSVYHPEGAYLTGLLLQIN